MSRNGKITAGNPISSIGYLKKKKWEALVNDTTGLVTDVVNYNDATKACDKAYNEAYVQCLDDIIFTINSLGFPKAFTEIHGCIIEKDNLEILLKSRKDKFLGSKK